MLRVLFLSFLLLPLALFAVPTPPSLEELVISSDYIARAKLTSIKENKLNKGTLIVSASAEMIKVYKGGEKLKKQLNLKFIVLPELYGKWFKATPQEGEYMLFFVNKKIKDKNGKETSMVVLYEPHPFAINEWSSELELQIQSLVK